MKERGITLLLCFSISYLLGQNISFHKKDSIRGIQYNDCISMSFFDEHTLITGYDTYIQSWDLQQEKPTLTNTAIHKIWGGGVTGGYLKSLTSVTNKNKVISATSEYTYPGPNEEGRMVFWTANDLRLEKIVTENMGPIHNIVYSDKSEVIATAGRDELVIRLWDLGKSYPIKELKGHQAPITQLRFNHNGTILASGDAKGTVKLWWVSSGKEIQSLKDNDIDVPIYGLSFSKNDRFLISTTGLGIIWDIEKGTKHKDVWINGLKKAAPLDEHYMAILTEQSVVIIDLETAIEIYSIPIYRKDIRIANDTPREITISKDNKYIVFSQGTYVQIWERDN